MLNWPRIDQVLNTTGVFSSHRNSIKAATSWADTISGITSVADFSNGGAATVDDASLHNNSNVMTAFIISLPNVKDEPRRSSPEPYRSTGRYRCGHWL